MGKLVGSSSAERKAKQAAAEQQKQLEAQKQQEELKAAEAEDEVARRKARGAGKGSASMLVATSETGTNGGGMKKTLGG